MNKPTRLINLVLRRVALLVCVLPASVLANATPDNPVPHQQSLNELDTLEFKPSAFGIKGWKTTKGSKVLFIRTTTLPMFDVHVSFVAGTDKSEVPDLADVTFTLLDEGVPGMESYSAIIDTFSGLGAQYSKHIDKERAALSLRSLSEMEKSTPALQLFSQILGEPLLSDDALTRIKNQSKNESQDDEQSPSAIASWHIRKQWMPQNRSSLPTAAQKADLKAITRQAVQDFHRQAYAANTAQITLVGDLSLEQAQLLSQQISNALPGSIAENLKMPLAQHQPMPGTTTDSPQTPFSEAAGGLTNIHVERELQQTYMLLAQPNVPDADDSALQMANKIFYTRLMNELRKKRGLVYDIEVELKDWDGRNLTAIALHISPQLSQSTQTLVRSMFDDYLRDGPTQEELGALQRLDKFLHASSRASNAGILERLVEVNRHDLPLDLDYDTQQTHRLSVKQIKDALARHFAADRWHVVTVGPTVEQKPLPLAGASSQHSCPAAQTIEAS